MIAACSTQVEELTVQVTRCADCPVERASATVFSVGSYAYVGWGRTHGNWERKDDLWRYDAEQDQWESMGITPLQARVNATAVPTAEGVYIGLGFNGIIYADSSYLRDWYRYQPETNQWERLQDYPGFDTNRGIAFAHEGAIYIVGASGKNFNNEVYRYDCQQDQWELMHPRGDRMQRAWAPTGAAWGTGCYIGTGFDLVDLRQWWFYDGEDQHWIPKQDMPSARNSATCAASDDAIYLFGGRRFHGGSEGGGYVLGDYYRYLPAQDQWQYLGQMPMGETENMAAVRIGNKIYFGLGENDKGMNTQWWRIDE